MLISIPETRPLTDGEHGIELGADGMEAVEKQNVANRAIDIWIGIMISLFLVEEEDRWWKFSKLEKSGF